MVSHPLELFGFQHAQELDLDGQGHIADKCDFCRHRLERGEQPACVLTCPTKARTFGDLNDPESAVGRMVREGKLVQVIAPHVNTRPNIYYCQGTRLLDLAVTPSLPGDVHMAREFWEVTGSAP